MSIGTDLTADELKKYLGLLRQVEVALKEINNLEDPDKQRAELAKLHNAQRIVEVYFEQSAAIDKLIKKEKALQKAAKDVDAIKEANHKKEVKRLEALKKAAKDIKKDDIKKGAQSREKIQKKLNELMLKSTKYQTAYNKSTEKWSDDMGSMKEGQTMITLATNIATGALQGSKAAMDDLTAGMAALATVMPSISFTAFRAEMVGMFNAYDQGFRGILKTGYSFQGDMEQIFAASLDPKVGKKFTGMDKTVGRMLTRMGITAGESSKAFIALKKNAMFFTADNISDNKAFTAEVTNLYAGLNKLGVGFDDSAQAFDIFTKSLKQAPRQALKSTKRLIKIASSLDITTGQAFRNFNKLMPNLAMFGDRAVDVFGKLAAQARATGIEVGGLAKIAEGMDTFKGAAKAAQGLNAVLGGTFISMTDLAHADPAEKIDIIRDAFKRAGLDFATAHRRVKQVVAGVIGKDVQTVSRLFGSEEDYQKVTGGLDTAAASSEAIKEKLMDQMTSAERLKRGLQDLNGGIAKVVRTSRKFADKASRLLTNTFNAVGESVKSADAQVLGFAASLGIIAGIAKARTKFAVLGTSTAVLAAMSKDQKEALAKKLGKEVKDLGTVSLDVLKATMEGLGSIFSDFFSTNTTKNKGPGAVNRDFAKNLQKRSDEALETQKLLATALNNFTKQLKTTPITIESNLILDGQQLASAQKDAIVNFVEKALS